MVLVYMFGHLSFQPSYLYAALSGDLYIVWGTYPLGRVWCIGKLGHTFFFALFIFIQYFNVRS